MLGHLLDFMMFLQVTAGQVPLDVWRLAGRLPSRLLQYTTLHALLHLLHHVTHVGIQYWPAIQNLLARVLTKKQILVCSRLRMGRGRVG
jgi:hypothetical protein